MRLIVPVDAVSPPQTTDLWSRWVPERQAYVQKVPIVVAPWFNESITVQGWRRDTPSARVRFDHNLPRDDPNADAGTELLTVAAPFSPSDAQVPTGVLDGTMRFPSSGCYEIWVTVGPTTYGPFGLKVRA